MSATWILILFFFGIAQFVQIVCRIASMNNKPFTPRYFYNLWKLNWPGAVIVCVLAYILFPFFGVWSLIRIGHDYSNDDDDYYDDDDEDF